MRKVFETGKPGITNRYKGPRTGRYVLGVEVPAFRGGQVVYDLGLAVHADAFAQVFSQQHNRPRPLGKQTDYRQARRGHPCAFQH
jgi:hypothetical protein